MTTRPPLDLRGLSLTELIQQERELRKELTAWFENPPDDIAVKLADRQQIREEMERRRGDTSVKGKIVWEPGPAPKLER